MKFNILRASLCCGWVAFLLGLPAYAQYTVDWFKISGGADSSQGAVYALSGTISQHDAGSPMVGGDYSLTGGFWSILHVLPK